MFGVRIDELDKKLSEKEKMECIKTMVERTDINNLIDISHLCWRFRTINFYYVKSENWYGYSADYMNRSGYYVPIKNTLRTFKTLEGAKRNFINNFLTEKENKK